MSRMKKAGLIPYYWDETVRMFKYLMMVSSDPAFGGNKPMVSKGCQDLEDEDGNQETVLDTAIREAEEELGLLESNLDDQPRYLMSKQYNSYDLYIFACKVKDPKDFKEYHYETEYVQWMTAIEFFAFGREDHKCFIDNLENKLNAAD